MDCSLLMSMGFSRQESWSDLPDPGIEPMSLMSPILACEFFITSTTWEAPSESQYSDYLMFQPFLLLSIPDFLWVSV